MRVRLNWTQSKSAGFQAPGGGMTKNGGRIWAHDWENSVVDPLGERSSQTVAASRCHRAERARARRPCSGTRSSGALTRARSPMRRGGRGRCPSLTSLTSRHIRVFSSCGTSLRSPPHAPPSGHGWFDGARRAPSNHPTPVTGSERAQPQEVPNRANSARLAAPLA